MSGSNSHPPPQRIYPSLLLLLSAVAAISPLGMVLLAPALDAIGERYNVDTSQTQFIVYAYLLGLAVAQPLVGVLCDRFGRRPVMLIGFAVFVVTSIVCAFVNSLEWLIIMRFLQAAGASVGTVTSRATVRDLNDASGSARALSYISAAMGLAPIIGPAIGGFISASYGPQAVFFVSAVMGTLLWIWAFRAYPETADPTGRTHPTLSEWLTSYKELLRSREFIGYSIIYGLAQSVFFAFMAVGAAVFEADLGLGPQDFGATWGLLAVAYVGGAVLTGKLAFSVSHRRLLWLGLLLIMIGSWALLGLVLTIGVTWWTLTMPLVLLSGANGVVTPMSMAGAVSYRPQIAGTSSGLSSAIGLTLSGLFTIVAGSIYAGDFTNIAVMMAIVATLTASAGLLTRPSAD